MAEKVEFGDRNAARKIRQDPKFQPFLSDEDDARKSTVRLKENVPERALEDITGEAADSKRHEAEKYGQAELSKSEKNDINFSRTNVMHARSAKAIARGKGVDDWTAYYDETLSTDELRDVFESASRDERGRRDLGRDPNSEAAIDDKIATAHHSVSENELDHAKQYAFGGDRDAQDRIRQEGSLGDQFDITFSRTEDDRLRGSGRDYERLEETHEERPQRAQTLDEKRTAQVTRDPFEWVNAPNRYDFPGIDTVQPRELHDERSSQAQAMDERDVAPIADTREQWAMNPGRYDWPGVDDVDPESFHASRSKAARTRDEKEIAPIADSKQQWAQNPGRYDWPGIDRPETYGPTMDEPVPEEERGRGLDLGGTGLAPEDFEREEFSESQQLSQTNTPFGLAGGEEADMAFLEAEQERAAGMAGGLAESGAVLDEAMGDVDDELMEWADNRDQDESLLGFGMETDATQHRDPRDAVEQATEFGLDDRTEASRGAGNDIDAGEQQGFEVFGGGVQENRGLDSF